MNKLYLGQKKALTFLEILLSAFLIAVTLMGILATFTTVRTFIERSDRRLVAFNVIRAIYDQFYSQVRADTWDDVGNPLTDSISTTGNMVIGSIQYDYTAQATDLGTGGLRSVLLTIDYPDSTL